jgi:hypothetical protein
MSRGIFEDVGSLPIVGIYDINSVYDTNMGVYTTSSLDILELGAIVSKRLKRRIIKYIRYRGDLLCPIN